MKSIKPLRIDLTLTVLLVPAILYWLRARTGLGLPDEGYLLSLAYRTLNGDVPYQDFFTLYPPGIYYLLAAAFQVTGPTLLVSRLVVIGVKLANLWLSLLIANRLIRSKWSSLVPVLILAIDLIDGMHLIPYPALLAQMCALAVWYLMILFTEQKRSYTLFVAGALCALSFFWKQPPGALITLATGLWLLLLPNSKNKRHKKLFDILIVSLTALFLAIPLVSSGSWLGICFMIPALISIIVFQFTNSISNPVIWWKRFSVWVAGGVSASIVMFLMGLIFLSGEMILRGVFLQPITEAGIRFTSASILAYIFGNEALLTLYLISFLLTATLLIIIRGQPDHLGKTNYQLLQLGLLIAGFMVMTLYPQPSSTRSMWIYEIYIILFVVAGFHLIRWVFVKSMNRRRNFHRLSLPGLLLLVLLIVFGGIGRFERWLDRGWTNFNRLFYTGDCRNRTETVSPSISQRLAICIPENSPGSLQLIQLADYVLESSGPDDSIFVFPAQPLLYFLTGRKNPTRFQAFGISSRYESLLEIFEDLEKDPPKFIISGPISRVPARLDRLINEKYAPVESFGAFTVLQRFPD